MVKGTHNMGYLEHSSKAQETKQKEQKGRAKGECDGATHGMAIAHLNLLHKIIRLVHQQTRPCHSEGFTGHCSSLKTHTKLMVSMGQRQWHSSVILATVKWGVQAPANNPNEIHWGHALSSPHLPHTRKVSWEWEGRKGISRWGLGVTGDTTEIYYTHVWKCYNSYYA